MLELGLRFPDPATVVVGLNEDGEIEEAAAQTFLGPLDAAAQQDLHWYLEVYPAHYMTEVDDERAERIAAHLSAWGAALFRAVFAADDAKRLIFRFQDRDEAGRLITVSAGHPAVLAQPWELLRDPEGTFLFLDEPRITVRRRLGGGGRKPFKVEAKDRLHLLFVVSRPSDVSFIDPRADPMAVMDSLHERAPGRVTVEFLRPATLDALTDRLEDEDRPAVDVLHFDGHGAYDADGRLAEAAKQAVLSAGFSHLLRDAGGVDVGRQGFLLFEKADGTAHPVPAALLGEMLNRKRLGLVVLSACQSAMLGGEDAMGSVAARLTDAGLPAVLAMTHSVLVATTKALFDQFYDELARGRPVGTALDNARRALYAHPERGQRRRGDAFVTLKLQDWFLPALYQAGRDTALLTKGAAAAAPAAAAATGLPPLQESGFWGRRRELWDMERWFVAGTRRLVVHGFGGQGKTELAAEAGRWLVRSGLFQAVAFLDYRSFQGVDAVGYAVATLGTALGRSLIDAAAATAALAATPTLLILDNLEAVAPEPAAELLVAAGTWSEAGGSRVVVTTRKPDLEHPAWPTAGSNRCRYLPLGGLQADDALDWFQELLKLPPAPTAPMPDRQALTALFARVDFHPLTIGVLAEVLKSRRIAEVGERLETLQRTEKDTLVASLTLSLERLDPALRAVLPRLGVFRGGALEPMIGEVTELSEAQWADLRRGLEHTGLIREDGLPGYLRFHPTLAPALWPKLSGEERNALTARHRDAYYGLSGFLYQQDLKAVGPVRAMARAELANLMAAVDQALKAGAPEAATFAGNVGYFLGGFGLARDRAALAERVQAAAGDKGSDSWQMARSQLGDQLFDAGRFAEAAAVFADVLAAVGDTPSPNRGWTLFRLARCHAYQGRPDRAAALQRQALDEVRTLDPTPDVRRLTGALQSELGTSLHRQGDLAAARTAHEAGLAIAREAGDERSAAVSLSSLGAIALEQGDLAAAEAAYETALETFRALGEPETVATCWHQLGVVYQGAERWEQAERAYRESARLEEERGALGAAATSWQQLAQVMQLQNKPAEAERWSRKALDGRRAAADRPGEAQTLNNLADLLRSVPGRLADACRHAEDALAIKTTLDPAAAEIWTTYAILAEIAQAYGKTDDALTFRRLERDSFAAAPAARELLRRQAPLIAAVAAAAEQPSQRPALKEYLDDLAGRGWGLLVAALRRLLDGERDADALTGGLDFEDGLIVATVLRALADPSVLAGLGADTAPPPDQAAAAQMLQKHAALIRAIAAVAAEPALRPQLAPALEEMRNHGWGALVDAVGRLLGGDRDSDALCRGLDGEDTLIVRTVLAVLDHPEILDGLAAAPPAT